MKPSEFLMKNFTCVIRPKSAYEELDKLFISKEQAKKELKELFKQTTLNNYVVNDILNEVLE